MPSLCRDGVGAFKGNAEVAAAQNVGILLDALDRLRAEHLKDFYGGGVADAVLAEVEHERAHADVRLELGGELQRLFGGNALELRDALGVVFHDVQRCLAELPDKLLRGGGSDALDGARGKVAQDIRRLGGAADLAGLRRKLSAIAAVLGKAARQHHLVAGIGKRHHTHGGDVIVAVGKLEDGVAVLVITVYNVFHHAFQLQYRFFAHSHTQLHVFRFLYIILHLHRINQDF